MIYMVIHMALPCKSSGWEYDLHGNSHAACHLHGESLFYSNHLHGESLSGLKRALQDVSR